MKIATEKSDNKIFNLFDIVKSRINEILLKGIGNISKENYSEIIDLRDKVYKMNLNLMGDLLERFVSLLGQLSQEKQNHELKVDASITAIKIISTARMFETVMNVEIIKTNLHSGGDS